jgi:hypothetical protein
MLAARSTCFKMLKECGIHTSFAATLFQLAWDPNSSVLELLDIGLEVKAWPMSDFFLYWMYYSQKKMHLAGKHLPLSAE